MTLSIIIPFYYGNKFINNLMNILNENYKQIENKYDMEVIIINDSPKESVNIDSHKYLFKTLIINNEENLGIHKTRIKGLTIANSEYILFLDQDDIIENNYIISQLDKINENDFIICNGFVEDKNKGNTALYANKAQQNLCLDKKCHYYCRNPIISPGQVVMKKSIIPQNWIDNHFLYNGADDHYLWILLLEENRKGVINPDKLYIHKYTGNNTSLNEESMMKSNMELLEQVKKISSKKNFYILKHRLLHWKYRRNIKSVLYLDGAIIKKIYRKYKWSK